MSDLLLHIGRVKALAVLAGLAVLLSACSFAPTYERPVMTMPSPWAPVPGLALEVRWWERFNDPVLNQLVEEALKYNMDLVAALARVDQARATLGLARAEIFPTINLEGSASKNRSSLIATPTPGTSETRSYEYYSGVFNAVWELDLWGKYRESYKSASASLLSSEAQRDGVILSLQAEVCRAYFNLRALDAQKAFTEETLQNRERMLQVYTDRYLVGDLGEIDYQRFRTEVDTAKVALSQYKAALEAAEGSLAVLIGRSPRDIYQGTQDRGLLLQHMPAPPVIPAGLPSDLLERRPDIRSAEQDLIAANADIGVARAAYFPSISLTGLLGYQSVYLDELFTEPASTWSYGATLSMPILDFGRVRARELYAEARQRELAAVYVQTVQQAFSDIRQALATQREAAFITKSQEDAVASLYRTTELALLQYEAGYADQLSLLDAERQLFSSGIDLITARRDQLEAIVAVCMALGGGWRDAPPPEAGTASAQAGAGE